MMTNAAGGGWSLLFMAALIPGFHLQRNGSSIQTGSNIKAQIYQPVLQPSESIPPTGMYTLRNHAGKPCIKASMGAEFIIIEKKTWYFNLDPSRVQTSGYCEKQAALMSLTLPDNGASLQFTFRKEKDVFYVTKITAQVSPLPVCQRCANKNYSGLVDHEQLFKTTDGRSFMCKSENLFQMSSVFNVKLVPLQIQVFTVPKEQYGKEVECWADFKKRVIPIVIGATVVGLILITLLTFLFIKDRRRQGYESL